MKIQFKKRDFIWIILLIVFLGVGFVYGYNSGNPSAMGHSADEIEVNDAFCQKITGHNCGSDISANTACEWPNFLSGSFLGMDENLCFSPSQIVDFGLEGKLINVEELLGGSVMCDESNGFEPFYLYYPYGGSAKIIAVNLTDSMLIIRDGSVQVKYFMGSYARYYDGETLSNCINEEEKSVFSGWVFE